MIANLTESLSEFGGAEPIIEEDGQATYARQFIGPHTLRANLFPSYFWTEIEGPGGKTIITEFEPVEDISSGETGKGRYLLLRSATHAVQITRTTGNRLQIKHEPRGLIESVLCL